MFELFAMLTDFVRNVGRAIGLALQLSPTLVPVVESYPQSRYVVFTIALLAGGSLLLGQSVTLFVNRVRPLRFVASLLLNGFTFSIGLIVWGVTIWVSGVYLFAGAPDLGVVIRIVALGSAPFVFGFFILIPYLGNIIRRVLSIWSFLVVLNGVRLSFQVGLLEALACVGLGWLLVQLIGATIGKPFIRLQRRISRRVSGSALEARVQDILAAVSLDRPPDRGRVTSDE